MPEVEIPEADTVANDMFAAMTAGVDFEVDLVPVTGPTYQVPGETGPLYSAVTQLQNADLTTGAIDGAGTFDALMRGFKAHLKEEFNTGRISGAEYTKAYIALTEGAMSNAVQFLLGRDQAYWQAVSTQVQAQVAKVQLVTARVQLETAKAQLQQTAMESQAAKANFALTRLKLATEAASFEGAVYTAKNVLPQQRKLLEEQTEAQRAQTLDTRSDGTTEVAGTLGKQKALFTQQIASYKRDAEVKAAKIFADAWITQKTVDEGLVPPNGFTNASVDTVLTALKVNNELD